MAEYKNRSLVYRRADWFRPPNDGGNLQKYIEKSVTIFPNLEDRKITFANNNTAEIRHFSFPGPAAYIHVVGYVEDEDATIVPHKVGVAEANLGTTAPPKGTDFMDGDFMARISKNHVVAISSGLGEGRVAMYLRSLFSNAGLDEEAPNFELLKIANTSVAQKIAKDGVKSINLDVALYSESLSDLERKKETINKIIQVDFSEIIGSLVSKDKSLEEIRHEENLQAKIVLTYDGRKETKLAKERLSDIANRLFDEDNEGFSIKTKRGDTITSSDIQLKSPRRFKAFGKSINYNESWVALDKFYAELKEQNLLEV